MTGKRVLVLIPHPDDEVVGTATAIARLRRARGEALGLYLTSGVPASAGSWLGGEKLYERSAVRRWNEATSVARMLGLSMAGRQQIPARSLKFHLDSSLRWIREKAKALGIDEVWTPAYEGGHQDHDVANFLAARLSDDYPVWEFSEYNFAGGLVRSQSFVEDNGNESVLVLSNEERALKKHLLLGYSSERKNLHSVRLDQEVLRPLADYDYSRRPHDGKLFYERFHWVPFHPRIDYCRPEEVCEAIRRAL